MSYKYNLSFISESDFTNHIKETVDSYVKGTEAIDLKKFNSNVIDPIKLLFDKEILNKSFTSLIDQEIERQRDKHNNNAIGYFHQNIFKYIENCVVPDHGWDIIVKKDGLTLYVEMKNKHNTMNSSSRDKIYSKMLEKIKTSNDENLQCALVEVIALKTTDKEFTISKKQIEDPYITKRIRHMSIDKFYEFITEDKFAFKKLCDQLIDTLPKVVKEMGNVKRPKDTVLDELNDISTEISKALFEIAFKNYDTFKK
ncbi:Eco47II family restriction endonuclease [Mycoplasma sp. 2045]|uniref:Eco47II family restriction endonuclease n=1 Tax=Mycoplasma sp. 2045 TaxID=2967301 RepID=UPI00211CE7EF|nr:Eco47II family restriction endonuclease [Mycoplasma sp. 2045]UUM20558.1 Eco47II family restriction endonuclease [Mycoplasma sp. 2045]